VFCARKKTAKGKWGLARKTPAKPQQGASEGILIFSNFGYFLKLGVL